MTARQLDDPRLLAVPAAVAAAVGLVAAHSPVPTLAMLAGCAMVVIALRAFPVALGLLTALTFFEGAPGFAGSLSVVKLTTLAILAAWVCLSAAGGGLPFLPRERPVLTATILLLAVVAAASTLWAEDAAVAESGTWRLVQMLLLLFLVFAAVRDRTSLLLFAWAFIGGAVLTTLVALAGGGGAGGGSTVRFGGYLGNPNNLAAALLPALALCGFMFLGSRRSLERLLLAACGGVLLVALFLSESRGGLVGLAVAVVAAIALAGPARRRVLAVVLVLLVFAAGYFAIAASSGTRHRVTSFSAAESTGRVDLWNVGIRMFERHPVEGVGLDNFTVLAPRYIERGFSVERADLILKRTGTAVHNTYLNVLAELGVVGEVVFLGLVVAILGAALGAVRALARSADRETELLARGLLAGTAGMLAAYFFFSAQYEKQLWLVLGALVALPTVAAARARPAPVLSSRT